MPTVPQGPEPTLLSRKQIDALYETFDAIRNALSTLNVPYIITGGSLLGAIRQHSILFCDDDIDVTIIDNQNGEEYEKVSKNLASLLGKDYMYSKRPWEGGDKVRPKRMSNIFVDIFTLRRYDSMDDLKQVIGLKKNGLPQSKEYTQNIIETIEGSAFSQDEIHPLCPFWHFNERKAIEMWPKEVYRTNELFPLCKKLKFGPLVEISGPRMPVLLLKRAFGSDCFDVFYQSCSHNNTNTKNHASTTGNKQTSDGQLKPVVLEGGDWSSASKVSLSTEHYLPMQPIARAKRRYTRHNKDQLFVYLESQSMLEKVWMKDFTHEDDI
jgi:hypothetical protein